MSDKSLNPGRPVVAGKSNADCNKALGNAYVRTRCWNKGENCVSIYASYFERDQVEKHGHHHGWGVAAIWSQVKKDAATSRRFSITNASIAGGKKDKDEEYEFTKVAYDKGTFKSDATGG